MSFGYPPWQPRMPAKLFGADPKHKLDRDLQRLKNYIETGQQPVDAEH